MSRADELLIAVEKLLTKTDESPYVVNALEMQVNYDDCDCDGYCLLNDIRDYLENEMQTKI